MLRATRDVLNVLPRPLNRPQFLVKSGSEVLPCEIAANPKIGPFASYEENRESMLTVMGMHRNGANEIEGSCPGYLRSAAVESLDNMVALGERYGYRNSQVTVLAPTGMRAFMMDCDTTGIEPIIALVKYKLLAGKGDGTLKLVNHTIPEALTHLAYK